MIIELNEAELRQLSTALALSERAISNWIALHPEEKDAIDTLALENIQKAQTTLNKQA